MRSSMKSTLSSSRNKSRSPLSSLQGEYKLPTNSYAEIHKKSHLRTQKTESENAVTIRNPFAKHTVSVSLAKSRQGSGCGATRNHPKVYTASLSSEELVPDNDATFEHQLRSGERNYEFADGNAEVSHDDSILDSLLTQIKSDKKYSYSNAKAIETLTEVNMNLIGQVQAMKKQMECIQLSQAERETAQVEASLTMDRKKMQVLLSQP
eukprot:TRINITY_DN4416_c0_g2_i4.p1 TRINITY_DN4416_c0_g2~~TRINITY_DN4416_c0_g2_i4.p1  ORF type:complete len:208 (-),score=12.83 TRINITY_DN4416_c0_g2_i4:438-1061(-)